MCLTMSILGVGKIIDDSIRLDRLYFIASERVALNTNKTEAGLTKDKRRKKVDFYSKETRQIWKQKRIIMKLITPI